MVQEGAIEALSKNDEDFLLVVHKVHDVGQEFITSSFFSESDRDSA